MLPPVPVLVLSMLLVGCVGVLSAVAGRDRAVETATPAPERAAAPSFGFVTAKDGGLSLGGKPYLIAGASSYYLYQYAADSGAAPMGRALVDRTFADAAALGLNVLRAPAHGEGPDTWHALQPAPGQFNEAAYADGLDYVVSLACKSNIKLLFWLTNQWNANGGMMQLARWAGAPTLHEFYTSSAAKALYKAGVKQLLTRRNTLTGRLYSEEPCILGWDLANEPVNKGDDRGDVLAAWVAEMAGYVRSLDPNHLIMTGAHGFFGASTPDKQQYNPPSENVWGGGSDLHTGIYVPYTALCQGQDIRRLNAVPEVDVVTVHLWGDSWYSCSDQCKVDAVRAQLRAQLQVAAELGKPLLVEEFGAARPAARRNAYFSMIYEELAAARAAGQPVAGSLFWMLAAPDYADHDGFTVYASQQPYFQQSSGIFLQPPPSATAVADAAFADFLNRDAYVECLGRHSNGTAAWNEGLDATVGLIKQQAAVMAASGG